jgi:hypothetical protein
MSGATNAGFVLCTIAVTDFQRTQDELQLSLDVASEKCPHCFSRMVAYTCRNCGEPVRLSNDPTVERIFRPENEEESGEDE